MIAAAFALLYVLGWFVSVIALVLKFERSHGTRIDAAVVGAGSAVAAVAWPLLVVCWVVVRVAKGLGW